MHAGGDAGAGRGKGLSFRVSSFLPPMWPLPNLLCLSLPKLLEDTSDLGDSLAEALEGEEGPNAASEHLRNSWKRLEAKQEQVCVCIHTVLYSYCMSYLSHSYSLQADCHTMSSCLTTLLIDIDVQRGASRI